ncbi:hypothetical protein AAGG49_21945, partial [Stenotrophomonas maltophilia]|uniref:hypothetical protein n=1 Tax=Stenotrophomonas maltophilia TaxID=40324 RepID=UPI00313C9247
GKAPNSSPSALDKAQPKNRYNYSGNPINQTRTDTENAQITKRTHHQTQTAQGPQIAHPQPPEIPPQVVPNTHKKLDKSAEQIKTRP